MSCKSWRRARLQLPHHTRLRTQPQFAAPAQHPSPAPRPRRSTHQRTSCFPRAGHDAPRHQPKPLRRTMGRKGGIPVPRAMRTSRPKNREFLPQGQNEVTVEQSTGNPGRTTNFPPAGHRLAPAERTPSFFAGFTPRFSAAMSHAFLSVAAGRSSHSAGYSRSTALVTHAPAVSADFSRPSRSTDSSMLQQPLPSSGPRSCSQ